MIRCISVGCSLCIKSANTVAGYVAHSSLSFDERCTLLILTLTKAWLLFHLKKTNCKLEVSPKRVLLQSWDIIRGMFHCINWVTILMTYCLLCNNKQLCHTVFQRTFTQPLNLPLEIKEQVWCIWMMKDASIQMDGWAETVQLEDNKYYEQPFLM